MQNFFTSHSFVIGMAIYCLLSFGRTYASDVYGDNHKRTLTFSAILSCVIVVALAEPAYSLWRNSAARGGQVPGWTAALAAAIALFMLGQLVSAVKKLMASNNAPVADTSDLQRADFCGASSLWFGHQQLIMTADRLYTRRRFTLRDAQSTLWTIAIFLIIIFWAGAAYALTSLIVPFTWALGSLAAAKVKAERSSVLLEVRGQMILVNDKRQGTISDARIDVAQGANQQTIWLRNAGEYGSCILMTTKATSAQQGEAIAGAIRDFLKSRQEEQVWPPAPATTGMGRAL